MIALATHTVTRLTRMVEVVDSTQHVATVTWTLGQHVQFDRATMLGKGPAKEWRLDLHALTVAKVISGRQ